MHARLVSFGNASPENHERAIQTIREMVIPTLREYDGFAGYTALWDEENHRAKGIILWGTEEQAVAAEQTLAGRRREMAGGVGLTIESEDLYEVIIAELE